MGFSRYADIIGNTQGMNNGAYDMLLRNLHQNPMGKRVDDLTLAEAVAIIEKTCRQYNDLYQPDNACRQCNDLHKPEKES